jgi:hypothetical protein
LSRLDLEVVLTNDRRQRQPSLPNPGQASLAEPTMQKLTAFFLLLIASLPLQAGIRVELESRGSGVGTESGRLKGFLLVDNNRLRMDLGDERSLIFLAAGPSVVLINHKDRWYTELDKASAASIAADIDPMVQELREQLGNLPENQREWVNEMLGGALNLSEATGNQTLRVEETDQLGKSPGGQQCRWLKIYRQDGLAQENCIAPSDALTGGQELESLLGEAAKFYDEIIGDLNSTGLLPLPRHPLPEMVPAGALAFISRRVEAGEIQTDTRILGSQLLEIDERVFQVPEDYGRKEPGLGMALP